MKYLAVAILCLVMGGCSVTGSRRQVVKVYPQVPLYDGNNRLNY